MHSRRWWGANGSSCRSPLRVTLHLGLPSRKHTGATAAAAATREKNRSDRRNKQQRLSGEESRLGNGWVGGEGCIVTIQGGGGQPGPLGQRSVPAARPFEGRRRGHQCSLTPAMSHARPLGTLTITHPQRPHLPRCACRPPHKSNAYMHGSGMAPSRPTSAWSPLATAGCSNPLRHPPARRNLHRLWSVHRHLLFLRRRRHHPRSTAAPPR